MKTADGIIGDYLEANAIVHEDLVEWLGDQHIPEAELDIHDSRYLEHLERYVAQRNAGNAS